jgi:hypothetical protein
MGNNGRFQRDHRFSRFECGVDFGRERRYFHLSSVGEPSSFSARLIPPGVCFAHG